MLRNSAILLYRLGAFTEANEAIHKALIWAPTEYRNWSLASLLFSEFQKEEDALRTWEQAIRFWPPNARSNPIDRALSLNSLGIVWLDVLRDAHPRWAQVLGDRMVRIGDDHTAILAFELAQELRVVEWDIPTFGLVLVRVGRVNEGFAMMDDMIQRYPNAPWVIRPKALALEYLGRFEEAAAVWALTAAAGSGDDAYLRCISASDLGLLTATEDVQRRLLVQKARCKAMCDDCK